MLRSVRDLARRRLATPAALALAASVSLAGCGGGGGGGSTALTSGSATQGGGTKGGTGPAASQAHWQVALAALAQTTPTNPVRPSFDQPNLDRWNDLFARSWPAIRAELIDPKIDSELRAQITGLVPAGKIVSIGAPRNVAIDTAASIGFKGRTAGTDLTLEVEAPLAPGVWRLAFTTDVSATIQVTIAGFPIQAGISLPVTVEARNVRISQSVRMDATNPARPQMASAGSPAIALDLSITSTDPLVSQFAGALTQILDPVIRVALLGGGILGQQQVASALNGIPRQPWGTGGAPAASVPGAPAFGPLADGISDEILAHHLPFGTLVSTEFSQGGFGNGVPVKYHVYGDSTIWTGHYLMAECLRYEMTGDPRALAGAERSSEGIDLCVGLSGTRGLLSRCVVPTSSPHYADIQFGLDAHVGIKNGIAYGGEGDISRDQYLGVFMGLTQAFLRVPTLRPRAQRVISDMVDFLDASDWIVRTVNAPHQFARFAPAAQTPGVCLAFMSAANLVDPARYGALHARYAGLSSIIWLPTWGSTREVHESYYKFNLQNDEFVILFATESDPGRYRDYVKALEITRDAVGHHDNPWFDSLYGTSVPSQAQAMGARVKNQLERWTLRPRRGFGVQNSTDPTIQTALYSSPLLLQSQAHLVSVHPVPIEKRVSGCFIWQTQCFELDGGESDTLQHTGMEFILPYWFSRSYGLLP